MKKIAFTIVLNGMPFIKRQAEIIPRVFDEWHIIEGATLPILDTSWCRNIDNKFYSDKKLSVDGTTEFLDKIADNKKIFIHRKNDFWNGKLEMCNQINDKMENCILMQFDVDEIWGIETLKEVVDYAITNEGFDGMLFKCNYFVGPDLIITTENTYGDKHYEWCRLWKVKEKTDWLSHEPPRIKGLNTFLTKDFTKKKKWIFNHYAYVLKEQIEFKENFYNYTHAVKYWEELQKTNKNCFLLKNFLPWVNDDAVVKRYNNLNMLNNIKKLNLGCAKDIKEGYLNIDLYDHPSVLKADVRDLSFLEDQSVEEIYAKDILEHMSLNDAKSALKEWSRVLKVGGTIFIQTINLDKQIEAYSSGVWSIEDFNYMLFAGTNWVGETSKCEDFHKCAYNFQLLEKLLKENNIKIVNISNDEIDPPLKSSPRLHNLNMMVNGIKYE